MKTILAKNGVQLVFEGEEAEAAFTTSIILGSRHPQEALHILKLIHSLIKCDAPEVSAKTRRFRIKVVKQT